MTRFALHFLLLTLWFLSGATGAAWGRSAGYDAYAEGSISGFAAGDSSSFGGTWVQTAGLRRLPETAASARDSIREEINRQFLVQTQEEARPQARSGYLHALYDFVRTLPFVEHQAAILEEIATIQRDNYTDLQDERSREAWASIFEGVYWDFLTEGLGPALGLTGTVTRAIRTERATISAADRTGDLGVILLQNQDSIAIRSAQSLAQARGEIVRYMRDIHVIQQAETLSLVAHGTRSSLAGMTASEVAALLRGYGYQGNSIELIACYTGSGRFAQRLSNLTRANVMAASRPVNVTRGIEGVPQVVGANGSLLRPGYGWETFQPQGPLRSFLSRFW